VHKAHKLLAVLLCCVSEHFTPRSAPQSHLHLQWRYKSSADSSIEFSDLQSTKNTKAALKVMLDFTDFVYA
jgi:hypothetical protein